MTLKMVQIKKKTLKKFLKKMFKMVSFMLCIFYDLKKKKKQKDQCGKELVNKVY